MAYEGSLTSEGGDDADGVVGIVGELVALVELDDGCYE